jgi:hypothetical protein
MGGSKEGVTNGKLRWSGYKGDLESDIEDVVSWGFESKGKENEARREGQSRTALCGCYS